MHGATHNWVLPHSSQEPVKTFVLVFLWYPFSGEKIEAFRSLRTLSDDGQRASSMCPISARPDADAVARPEGACNL